VSQRRWSHPAVAIDGVAVVAQLWGDDDAIACGLSANSHEQPKMNGWRELRLLVKSRVAADFALEIQSAFKFANQRLAIGGLTDLLFDGRGIAVAVTPEATPELVEAGREVAAAVVSERGVVANNEVTSVPRLHGLFVGDDQDDAMIRILIGNKL